MKLPTLFGKRMKRTAVKARTTGYYYVSRRSDIMVQLLQLGEQASWRYNVSFGVGAWLQSDDVFGDPHAAAKAVEQHVRKLRSNLLTLMK